MTETDTNDQASGHPDSGIGGSPSMRHSGSRERRIVVMLMAGMTLLAVLLLLVVLPQYKHWIGTGSTEDVLRKMTWLFYGMSLSLLIAAGWVAGYARRIFRSGESPPPGSWVLRDTIIRRGNAARARGWWMVACSACFVLFAVYAASVPAHLRTIAHDAAARLHIRVQH